MPTDPMTQERLDEIEPRHLCHDTERECELCDELKAVFAALREAWESKDSAYSERNQLVAYLAHLFPSCLERHPEEDTEWEDDWRWIVFIHHPSGQLSWHIHDSELPLFGHVQRGIGNVKWDGHTTEEKYARLRSEIDA